jgi:hypothetical protein
LLGKEDSISDETVSSEERWSLYVDHFIQLSTTQGIRMPHRREPFLRRNLPLKAPDEPPIGVETRSGLELKICINTYKIFFVEHTEDYFCRRAERASAMKDLARREKCLEIRRKKFTEWLQRRENGEDENEFRQKQKQRRKQQQVRKPASSSSSKSAVVAGGRAGSAGNSRRKREEREDDDVDDDDEEEEDHEQDSEDEGDADGDADVEADADGEGEGGEDGDDGEKDEDEGEEGDDVDVDRNAGMDADIDEDGDADGEAEPDGEVDGEGYIDPDAIPGDEEVGDTANAEAMDVD